MNNDQKTGKAIVIGGSMAGLLTARVLADYYDEVLIVDRDELPEGPVNRNGTPQAYHSHRMLPRGTMILEKLFPGCTDDLLAHGAYSRENKIAHFINRFGSLEGPDKKDAGCSRALLEWVIRERVKRIPNVQFLTKHEVTGLQTSPDRNTITGVRVQERGESKQKTTLAADIVIMASGRASKLTTWLQELGYEVPEPERLKVSLGYSTRYYQIPPHLTDKWSVIFIDGDPAKGIGTGVFEPIENNVGTLILYRAGGEAYPTTDGSKYEQEAAELLNPLIAEVMKELEPLAEPRGYRVPECVRQHFEQMEQWPSGLLVLGDAFCNFDPIFGQGITIAAIEVEMLEACLREQRVQPRPDFELSILARMQDAIEPAWWLSAVADLRWPSVEYVGHLSPRGFAFTRKYMDLVLKQAIGQRNMALFEKYWIVNGLFASPRELINPELIATVLASDASTDGEQLLAEFLQDGVRLEELLEEIIPSFTQAYPRLND